MSLQKTVINITQNGTATLKTADRYLTKDVDVIIKVPKGDEVILEESKTAIPSEYRQIISPSLGFDGLQQVIVEPIPPEFGGIKVEGTIPITANGTYDVSTYAEAYVKIDPKLQQLEVTPGSESQTFTPEAGYDGLGEVTVGPIPSDYVKPEGTIEITTTGEVDVSGYSKAQISDANLTPENIKVGTSILGVTGTLVDGSGIVPPTGNIAITYSGLYDVAEYATVTFDPNYSIWYNNSNWSEYTLTNTLELSDFNTHFDLLKQRVKADLMLTDEQLSDALIKIIATADSNHLFSVYAGNTALEENSTEGVFVGSDKQAFYTQTTFKNEFTFPSGLRNTEIRLNVITSESTIYSGPIGSGCALWLNLIRMEPKKHYVKPTGIRYITNLDSVDVSDFAQAQIQSTTLIGENIKEGVTILGVVGTYRATDTSSATAVASDLLEGKTAFARSEEIVGTLKTYDGLVLQGAAVDVPSYTFLPGSNIGDKTLYINCDDNGSNEYTMPESSVYVFDRLNNVYNSNALMIVINDGRKKAIVLDRTSIKFYLYDNDNINVQPESMLTLLDTTTLTHIIFDANNIVEFVASMNGNFILGRDASHDEVIMQWLDSIFDLS